MGQGVELGHPDAHREMAPTGLGLVSDSEELDGAPRSLGGGQDVRQRLLDEYDHELLAAEAVDLVALTTASDHGCGHGGENLIAGKMAVVVVVGLDVIDVGGGEGVGRGTVQARA